MIVGINGRMRAGKDTTCTFLQEMADLAFIAGADDVPDIKRVAFADKLKKSAAACLGITVEVLEEWKNDETKVITLPDGTTFTLRQYLQWFGTEGHRMIFGDDFWIEAALADIEDDDNVIYVITDCRFPNEIEAINKKGGIILQVQNERVDNAPREHASEQEIDPQLIDIIVPNHGTLEDLCEEANWLYHVLNKRRFEINR